MLKYNRFVGENVKFDKNLFHIELLKWYHKQRRILPWREDATAYHVWVSEIMLQQTRVEAVKGYYDRFMKRLPSIYDLASMNDEELLKLWEGLGYYSRVRNLKKAAGIIVKDYQGMIPDTYEELISLPGIGDYTAGAILSIAYQKKYPALDGNVFRVLTRVFENPIDILSTAGKKEIRNLLVSILPDKDNHFFTQALMELGATVCIPNGVPNCDGCPLKDMCLAHLHHQELSYPVKKPKQKRKIENRYVFLITCQNKVLLNQREEKGLLANFYEFPNFNVKDEEVEVTKILKDYHLDILSIEEIEASKHIFTHLEWHMKGYHISVENPSVGIWATMDELNQIYPLPNAFKTYREVLETRLLK